MIGKVKEKYFCSFFKGYRYEDKLGSKKNSNRSSAMVPESLLVFLNVYKNESASCNTQKFQ
jgi:hypothetical protein